MVEMKSFYKWQPLLGNILLEIFFSIFNFFNFPDRTMNSGRGARHPYLPSRSARLPSLKPNPKKLFYRREKIFLVTNNRYFTPRCEKQYFLTLENNYSSEILSPVSLLIYVKADMQFRITIMSCQYSVI